jgi:hypothetical protein
MFLLFLPRRNNSSATITNQGHVLYSSAEEKQNSDLPAERLRERSGNGVFSKRLQFGGAVACAALRQSAKYSEILFSVFCFLFSSSSV